MRGVLASSGTGLLPSFLGGGAARILNRGGSMMTTAMMHRDQPYAAFLLGSGGGGGKVQGQRRSFSLRATRDRLTVVLVSLPIYLHYDPIYIHVGERELIYEVGVTDNVCMDVCDDDVVCMYVCRIWMNALYILNLKTWPVDIED